MLPYVCTSLSRHARLLPLAYPTVCN
uniref:Uncharacterized protein n=1 Tax=Arundo donax TaxID=35708 RepID=A0A0A9TLI8_ARUDO